jgi:hypothetical protein
MNSAALGAALATMAAAVLSAVFFRGAQVEPAVTVADERPAEARAGVAA